MRIALLISSIALCCVVAMAQESRVADSLLVAARADYDDGRFDEAELKALRGLRELGEDEFARIPFHLLLGYIYVARDQNDFAYREFTRVVSLNPAYDLDPVMTSPKIVEVFRSARQDYMDRVLSQPEAYRLPQADVRMSASLRSLVLPGWGQYYKQQKIKGTAFAVAQIVSLAALIVLQAEADRRHDDYLAIREFNSPIVEDRYQEYRRAYRMRNAVGYVTLGIYILNYLDALYTPVVHKRPPPR